MTAKATKNRRLARAGYVPITVGGRSGWIPAAFASRVVGQIDAHLEDVKAICDAPVAPRGRPKSKP